MLNETSKVTTPPTSSHLDSQLALDVHQDSHVNRKGRLQAPITLSKRSFLNASCGSRSLC